jgi:hypothetical protein
MQTTATDTTETPRRADPLRRLPAAAKAKLEHLRRIEQRSRALVDGIEDERERVRQQRDDATRQLAIFDRNHAPQFKRVDDPATGGTKKVPVEYPERVELLGQIEDAKAELQRLAAEQREASLNFSVADLAIWAQQDHGRLADVPAPKLPRGTNLSEALEANRAEQSAIADQLEALRNAPLSTAEAKSRMRAEVAALAERGRPMVDGLFYENGITWPETQIIATGAGETSTVVAAFVPDALALAVWANQAAVTAALEKEIERAADGRTALTFEARKTKLAECEAALLEAQRRGEVIVSKIEAEGRIVRRSCVDPFVLLGVTRQDA